MFYNPERPMRQLSTHFSSRAWRRLLGAGALLVCGLLAVPSIRSGLWAASGAVFGAEASQAAAQTPETFIQQARRALAQGRPAQAEALAKARPAGDPDAAVVLARVESRRGRYDEARRLLEAGAAVNASGEAALELGLLLQHQFGRGDTAAQHFNRVLERGLQGPDTEAVFRAARAAQALGRMQDANSLYRVAARGGDPASRNRLGRALSRDLQSRRSVEVLPAGHQGRRRLGSGTRRDRAHARRRRPADGCGRRRGGAQDRRRAGRRAPLSRRTRPRQHALRQGPRAHRPRAEDQPVAPRGACAARSDRVRSRRQSGIRRRDGAHPRHQPVLRRGVPRRRRSRGATLSLRRGRRADAPGHRAVAVEHPRPERSRAASDADR